MPRPFENGYRIDRPASELPTVFHEVRACITDAARQELASVLAQLIAASVDGKALATALGQPIEDSPLPPLVAAQLVVDLAQNLRHKEDAHVGDLDFNFQVVFLADLADESCLYALVYTDRPVFIDAWQQLSFVQPYGFWDNFDAPSEIPPATWEERSRCWERLVGLRAPVSAGLTWDLLGTASPSTQLSLTAADVLDHLPSAETRRSSLEAHVSGKPEGQAVLSSLVIEPLTLDQIGKGL